MEILFDSSQTLLAFGNSFLLSVLTRGISSQVDESKSPNNIYIE